MKKFSIFPMLFLMLTFYLPNASAQNFPYLSFEWHSSRVNGMSFSVDGQTFATGSSDYTVHVWAVDTRNRLQRILQYSHGREVSDVAVSPDGQTIASCGDYYSPASISLWEVSTGERFWHAKADGWTYHVSFSPDGKILASCGSDNTIDFWDPGTGERLRTLTGHASYVYSIAFSPDGQLLASCSRDQTIRLYEVNRGRFLQTFIGHTSIVSDVSFSPDGQTLASAGDDGVRLWDVATGSLLHTLTVDADWVGDVSFSPDGQTLASGDAAGHIRLWEVSTGRPLYTLTGHGSAVGDVLFSPDEQTLAAGYYDGAVHLWELPATHVRIIPDTFISADVGEQFTVDINIVGGQNVKGYEVSMRFDGTAFKFVSSENGDFLPSPPNVFSITPVVDDVVTNTVTLASTSLLDEPSNGDGTLASVTFEVLDTKGSFIDLFDVRLKGSLGEHLHVLAHSAKIDPFILGDINGDGRVNIQDLVMVSNSFGQPVPAEGNPADVNEDGVINIIDLVIIAGEFGNTAAAPTMLAQTQHIQLTKAEVQQWLTQARQLNLTDPRSQQGIRFLEQLLAAFAPEETALLTNYPNPFNPETWIPYQLANPADVNISIYAADSRLVRTLDLGHQPIGIYQAKSRAAYWNGKNEIGESVASGLYFYTLTAGDFTATRKMLILK